MVTTSNRITKFLLVAAFTVLGAIGLAGPSVAAPQAVGHATVAQAGCGDTSGYRKVALSSLPKQATDTVKLIKQGGPFPYPGKDGSVFTNVEKVLPVCSSSSYYHEYTVITPGAPTRGTRRIVTGSAGEYFYTGDHYKTFQLVNINA
ncbi:hypothetical protein GCM10010174_45880 [Kutzneria viridogrisea]|uniref:Uncharacterized protein n=2 Tax=Kutzneria TaxID=43356 RepID=W5WRC7_9PSEU|nr:ribonuclease domain-containing protein [Kutzneria albida]AHI00715.1 hypothetical protein KALB_7357 [Kutzneria albida DSM 43870]MBA8925988.1 guanyl-specific ribonuclease Sa [Kutzneria viridogrisea]